MRKIKKHNSKSNRFKGEIEKAKKELKEQRIFYKDKPVNGEITDKQYNAIKGFCRSRGLKSTLIGINRREASEILTYFFNKSGEEKKPKCWDKYISDNS